MHRPVLGVLGGVGPLATACFMELVIRQTNAATDQENIPMIVFNNPQIPDRTAHILDPAQPDPTLEMVKVAGWLEEAGADYLAIPCNTAHYYIDSIASAVRIPVLNIMRETAQRLADSTGAGAQIGLLATEGTVRSGVFQSYFEQLGLRCSVPSPEAQRRVTSLIYDCVKASNPYDPHELVDCARSLHEAGCDAVVVGCTELSVIYRDLADRPPWLFDSLDILAERCVALYRAARANDHHFEA